MTTRGVIKRQRPNGKWDVWVIFYTGTIELGPTILSSTAVYKNVGPRAADAFIATLKGVLDETYAQGYTAAQRVPGSK